MYHVLGNKIQSAFSKLVILGFRFQNIDFRPQLKLETIVDRREIENYFHRPKYEPCSCHMDPFHDGFNDLYKFD